MENLTKIVNLTPHDVMIVNPENEQSVVIPATGYVARVTSTSTVTGSIAGIPVYTTQYGDVETLPAPTPDTYYIVSRVVAAAIKRDDLLIPSQLVRDENGRIVGCKGFETA